MKAEWRTTLSWITCKDDTTTAPHPVPPEGYKDWRLVSTAVGSWDAQNKAIIVWSWEEVVAPDLEPCPPGWSRVRFEDLPDRIAKYHRSGCRGCFTMPHPAGIGADCYVVCDFRREWTVWWLHMMLHTYEMKFVGSEEGLAAWIQERTPHDR